MPKKKSDRFKGNSIKKHRSVKSEAIRLTRRSGLNRETTESLIKEIEEIWTFENSLRD